MAEPLKNYYSAALSKLLAQKIKPIYPDFNDRAFFASMKKQEAHLELKARIQLQAELLYQHLPKNYKETLGIFEKIMGDENPHETGMFTHYYWLSPIAEYIALYGIHDFKASTKALELITKRNTAEFAIRPFIVKYPQQSLQQCKRWATHKNFHVRRLASEGIRPKLPWAKKLELFVEDPTPVFEILTLLKNDPIKYVQKSVANNINDYFKLNKPAAQKLITQWEKDPSSNENTSWIIKHATRTVIKTS
jgi:3-methyladenine DNA glycosylase AlkC